MPFATASDGVRLYYETEGSGEPLLLVVGPGSDHHGWDPLRAESAARWQVIIFDYRGTGQSDKPERPPYSTRGIAQDEITLPDHVGLERAHVYGISIGGPCASGWPMTIRPGWKRWCSAAPRPATLTACRAGRKCKRP